MTTIIEDVATVVPLDETDISISNTITVTDIIVAKENTDPVPNSVDFETIQTHDKNSLLLKTDQPHDEKNALTNTDADLSSLDAALDNLNDQVASLLDEASASNVKSDSPDAPLDEALVTLNRDFLGLLKESRKIQDELKKVSDAKEPTKLGSRCGSSQGIDRKEGNQYFDYSLYRETSQSPPPHPLTTYRWADIQKDKEKVSIMCMLSIKIELKKDIFNLKCRVVILGLI